MQSRIREAVAIARADLHNPLRAQSNRASASLPVKMIAAAEQL